ncbi:MAG: phosphoribosylglycinamide formyltransferase [Bacteroidetes bacterium]|nr:phosphoribosylglycinamide formyltransferase [Bacteroidota bacterium]
MKKIAIFASGAGSNAAKIIDYFRFHTDIKISLVVCNKPGAGVLDIAKKEDIPTLILEKENFFRGSAYLPDLNEKSIDFIVLAGFLWKIPVALVKAYPGKIINIHPALLPKYGGKGMYGQFVHEAVVAAKETETGITIHYVDELYDHGQVIFQERVALTPDDTPTTVAEKVQQLEHEHFPKIIEAVINQAGRK